MTLKVNGFFPGELKPDAKIGGCIEIFENVWPNPKETIELVERECRDPDSGAYWQQAETLGAGAYQDKRTNKLLSISHSAFVYNNQILQNIHNQFYLALLAASIPYSARYNIGEELWHEDYSLLKYSLTQEYKPHYDSTSKLGRIISALLYLNDDYEGGELEFVNFNVKIKPEPGMLVLFPSNYAYAHRALPISNGTKYALVTWIHDQRTR